MPQKFSGKYGACRPAGEGGGTSYQRGECDGVQEKAAGIPEKAVGVPKRYACLKEERIFKGLMSGKKR